MRHDSQNCQALTAERFLALSQVGAALMRELDEERLLHLIAHTYAQGELSADELPSLGIPAGHPVVRSFLGAPLLDRSGEVRGGLLLGHGEPGQFTEEDQVILVGLAGQAAVALENARLYRLTQLLAERQREEQAQQLRLQASLIALAHDAILVKDPHHRIIFWNRGAEQLYGWTAQEAQGQVTHTLLSVRDHGMGIPAQQQARIFGRFTRAENARTAEIAGTGLGLYLSRELVERNGGHIWFESTEGAGTTFFVALPLIVAERV